MKIIVTGSLGDISKPLTKELIQKGHSVTVISSKAGRQDDYPHRPVLSQTKLKDYAKEFALEFNKIN